MDIWDHERSEPLSSFSWGADTITALRFNPAEPDVLASAGSDRSVALYDLRSSTPIRKIIMQARPGEDLWVQVVWPACSRQLIACGLHPEDACGQRLPYLCMALCCKRHAA